MVGDGVRFVQEPLQIGTDFSCITPQSPRSSDLLPGGTWSGIARKVARHSFGSRSRFLPSDII